MPVYGVRVDQRSDGKPFSNRFYSVADSLTDACANGAEWWDIVRNAFASAVTNVNVHAWVIGASPNQFLNLPRSSSGVQAVTDNLKPEIVARYTYGAESSYPYYNDLRLRVSQEQLEGTEWSDDFKAVLATVRVSLTTFIGNDKMVLKNGDSLGICSYDDEYQFRKLSKRWYNRSAGA